MWTIPNTSKAISAFPSSITQGPLCVTNVKINTTSLEDQTVVKSLLDEAEALIRKADQLETNLLLQVEKVIAK